MRGLAALALACAACASARAPDVSSEPPSRPAPAEPAAAPVPVTEPAPVASALPAPAPTAGEPACPAPEHPPHCLWIATRPANPVRARHVARRLQKDGYQAEADGDRIIVHLSDAELTRLFGAAPGHAPVAASASDRTICVATLPETARLDAAYAGEAGDFVLDDPTCEL